MPGTAALLPPSTPIQIAPLHPNTALIPADQHIDIGTRELPSSVAKVTKIVRERSSGDHAMNSRSNENVEDTNAAEPHLLQPNDGRACVEAAPALLGC
jgi:hypothetical protein